MSQVRAPAVAGAFYPASAAALQSQVSALLDSVPRSTRGSRPKALIAPHAGYVYSGPTAAHAYSQLTPWRDEISRVVLVGPAHRVRVSGLALPAAEAFATPLGTVPLDSAAMAQIRRLPQVCTSDEAHAWEHSLEVHLPFLQRTLTAFTLIPVAVGNATPAQVAEVLNLLWGGDETLIVISSDLSHYLSYAQAQAEDERTATSILDLQPRLNHQQACGATPVNGLLLEARARGLSPRLLDQCNSGDTAGDKNRVVGYASFAFYPADRNAAAAEPEPDGSLMISLARGAISSRFGLHYSLDNTDAAWLDRLAATFITLKKDGRLRGCIGSLQAHRSLREDIGANARAAAFQDPRFAPLKFEELMPVRIEVSLLSPLEPVEFGDEADLLRQLRPGMDGLVLEHGRHRGTFLPQVWESLPAPAQFLGELKRKAGLPADFWDAGIRVSRYGVSKWTEPA
jgi:AmmeMemoRadiSam system protein B/AmmeMemoRadiSam system protein A